MTDRLTLRQLNRALLDRQGLLERRTGSALSMIDHLVGMQSQAPLAPYVGLWSRLSDFNPAELVDLMTAREALRIVLMRGTIHLVIANDALAIRPLVAEVMRRGLAANKPVAAAAAAAPSLIEVGSRLLSDSPLNPAQLSAALADAFPGHDPALLSRAVRDLVPCVQIPPRGLWGKGGQPTLTTPTTWLASTPHGSNSDAAPLTIDDLVRRYLAAFGPASVLDAQAWSGLTRLGEVFDHLRPQLRTYSAPDGRELFDLPSLSLPPEDVPAPIRFVAEFDNLLLSHADRTRVIADAHRREIITINGIVRGTILIDGFVSAWWKATAGRTEATLRVTTLPTMPVLPADAVIAEGNQLLEFLAPAVASRAVNLLSATP